MQKVIGEKAKFAIQFEVIETIEQFVYGRICYWINGMQLGDYTSITILSDIFIFLPWMIKDNENREHERFFEMKKEDVYYLLGGQAYLDSNEYEEVALEETWARFNITFGLDIFNDIFITLIDYEEKSRIVFYHNGKVDEHYLERGIVDNVFLTFYQELDRLCEELTGK